MSCLFLIAHIMGMLIELRWAARNMPLTSVFRETEYLFTRNRMYTHIHIILYIRGYTSDTVQSSVPTQLCVGSHECHKIFLMLLCCVTSVRGRPVRAHQLNMFNNSERTNERTTNQRTNKRQNRSVVPIVRRLCCLFVFVYFSFAWV